MLPTPPIVPAGVKTPDVEIVPSSPRSIDQLAPVAVPPTRAVKARVGRAWPVTTVTVCISGAIVRSPCGAASEVTLKMLCPSSAAPSLLLTTKWTSYA
jgi:hypothetical protein